MDSKEKIRMTERLRKRVEVRHFWELTAKKIKAYHDAPSTSIYFQQEKSLLETYLAPLKGKLILKTDLWNEAKNTRLLWWMQAHGARVVGIDISSAVHHEAKEKWPNQQTQPWLIQSDLRDLPLAENIFDAVYSMGTIEHFPEYQQAVEEIYRVLRPGGKAIIGVPNQHDLFLRPLQVFILKQIKLYAFGYEKSFTRKQFINLLEKTGFKILAEESLLFMPGWLRMMDLFCFQHAPYLLSSTQKLINFFDFLYKKNGFFHRRGYLLAMILKK